MSEWLSSGPLRIVMGDIHGAPRVIRDTLIAERRCETCDELLQVSFANHSRVEDVASGVFLQPELDVEQEALDAMARVDARHLAECVPEAA